MSMPYISLSRPKRGFQIMKEEILEKREPFSFEDMNGVSENDADQRSYTDMVGESRKSSTPMRK
jgi:hypothetical protein